MKARVPGPPTHVLSAIPLRGLARSQCSLNDWGGRPTFPTLRDAAPHKDFKNQHDENTEHTKYPESERNAVNPNEKTTQLARKSFTSPPTQEQPQHQKSSSSEAQGGSRL
jgi:hypothetical protein